MFLKKAFKRKFYKNTFFKKFKEKIPKNSIL